MTDANNTITKKKTKKKSKKKANKAISLGEFKAWLEGLDDALGDGWVPNEDQWARIRDKIDSIDIIEPVAPVAAPYQPPVINNMSPQIPIAPAPTPLAPPGGSSLDAAAVASKPPAQPVNLRAMATGDPAIPVKTPNIDTTDGNYTSTFE